MEKSYMNIIAKVLILVEVLSTICSSFVYIHWTAYKIAAHHIDYEQVVPPTLLSIVSLLMFIIFLVRYVQTDRILFKYFFIFFLVIMIGAAITAVSSANAYCPICNNVNDDKWYLMFYKLFKGKAYEPI